MDAIVEGGDFETRQRPRRTGKRFGRSRSESTKERAWFCCPRTYRRFGVWLNFRARRDLANCLEKLADRCAVDRRRWLFPCGLFVGNADPNCDGGPLPFKAFAQAAHAANA